MLVEREDGSLLVAGSMSADPLADRLGIELPRTANSPRRPAMSLSVLKKLPAEGEHFDDQGWRFEVVDMDGRRIDKLLVSRDRRPQTRSRANWSRSDSQSPFHVPLDQLWPGITACASRPSPCGAAMIARVTAPLATVLVSVIADSPNECRERRAGAVERAGFHAAARSGAAEQRIERLLARGAFGRARGAGRGRGQAEIGRHHQRRLTLHGEFVGPVAVEDAAAAASRQACAEAPASRIRGVVLRIIRLRGRVRRLAAGSSWRFRSSVALFAQEAASGQG